MAQSGLARGLPCHGPTLPLTQEWEAGHRGHLTLTLRSKRVASHWSIGFPAPQSTPANDIGLRKDKGSVSVALSPAPAPSPSHTRRASVEDGMGWHSELEPTKLRTRRCERFCLRFDLRDAMRWSGSATCHCSCTGIDQVRCCVVFCTFYSEPWAIRSDPLTRLATSIVVGEWGRTSPCLLTKRGAPTVSTTHLGWMPRPALSPLLLVGLRMIPVAEPIKSH